MYSHIKDCNKLPFDEEYKYLKLSEENKKYIRTGIFT